MSIAAVVGKRTFQMGDSGDAVRQVQTALRDLGYKQLTGTGYFGAQTDTAVEDFQRRSGLRVDGVVGPNTAKAIDAASVPQSKPAAVMAGASTPLWLAVSLDNVGLKEGAGVKDNKELVADIRTVASDYQHDATPWCAGWVSFCLSRAGYKPTTQPLWALSYSDVKNQPVVKLAGPCVGAIAVKTRNGGGHVTFIAGRTKGGTLACCGGNQNDEVNVSPYAEAAFVGFFWPKNAPLPAKTGFWSLPIVNTLGKPVTTEA